VNHLPYNREVRDLLNDLAELNPIVGPDELVALWFDTLYFPCQSYVPAGRQAEWASCFSNAELVALAKFHVTFDAVADDLQKGSANWREDRNWRAVAAAAKVALEELDAEG
jgi:hypothetical protein